MRLSECTQRLWRYRSCFAFVYLLLRAFCGAAFATGGLQQYIARSWSADDGLPHNYILAVTADA